MRQPNSRRVIIRDKYDAVLLDLDGVITDTARDRKSTRLNSSH